LTGYDYLGKLHIYKKLFILPQVKITISKHHWRVQCTWRRAHHSGLNSAQHGVKQSPEW